MYSPLADRIPLCALNTIFISCERGSTSDLLEHQAELILDQLVDVAQIELVLFACFSYSILAVLSVADVLTLPISVDLPDNEHEVLVDFGAFGVRWDVQSQLHMPLLASTIFFG